MPPKTMRRKFVPFLASLRLHLIAKYSAYCLTLFSLLVVVVPPSRIRQKKFCHQILTISNRFSKAFFEGWVREEEEEEQDETKGGREEEGCMR